MKLQHFSLLERAKQLCTKPEGFWRKHGLNIHKNRSIDAAAPSTISFNAVFFIKETTTLKLNRLVYLRVLFIKQLRYQKCLLFISRLVLAPNESAIYKQLTISLVTIYRLCSRHVGGVLILFLFAGLGFLEVGLAGEGIVGG